MKKDSYDHSKIERKWQKVWEKTKIYKAKDFSKKPKFYGLIEFPYPSGDGLHVGHIRSNTAMDIVTRKRRMEGYNVMYPIGWDAFGLPTESYAIKTGIQPAIVTKKNTDNFRKQLKEVGFGFDWSREINTTDPKYYKWTQWLFLQFYKHGLAYKAKATINWCPKDKIGLANEEVIDGKCERCGTEVEKREKEQWMLAITKYADRLSKDLDKVDYIEPIKIQQRNWIKNLHDWIFSRQRYWGEPIPMIHCEKCGWQPVPEKDLPVKLPKVKKYEPTDTGESPLSEIKSFVNTKCPNCKGPAKRETDTMPNWAGSSWYYLRYMDPKNSKVFADRKKMDYWSPVDWYNGGMEHATLHLLYSRFWHKFFFDIGLVPTDEPYKKRTAHGLILAEGGEKMSKSKGNVINPHDMVETYGADTFRVYEMFMGPFDQAIAWSTDGMVGARRFIERVWFLKEKTSLDPRIRKDDKIQSLLHKTIKKVTEDIENMRFNTAISSMMIFSNQLEKETEFSRVTYETFLKLLAPFAPHITEELWSKLGNKKSIHLEKWPEYDPKLVEEEEMTIVIQINGKTRATIKTSKNSNEDQILEMAKNLPSVEKWLQTRVIKRKIYVPGRILNIIFDDIS